MATGEFTQDHSPMSNAVKDTNDGSTGTGVDQENGYATDVDGIAADDVVKYGQEEFPVFDVSAREFYSNMNSDRKKLRFTDTSKVTQYKNKTRNSLRPFYIRMKDSDGKSYTRKIR